MVIDWIEMAKLSKEEWAAHMKAWASDSDPERRKAAAAHAQTPVESLEQLARDSTDSVRAVVAGNPRLPSASLEQLCEDSEPTVQLAAARSQRLPASALAALAEHSDPRIRRAVACDPTSPQSTVAGLERDDDEDVRWAVAANANAQPDVLRVLAGDVAEAVRRQVAYHKNTPSDVLQQMLLDAEELMSVREAALNNTGVPAQAAESIVIEMQRDLDRVLEQHHGDGVLYDRGFASLRTRSLLKALQEAVFPMHLLEKAARSRSAEVRAAVAAHSGATIGCLEELSNDGNEHVREVARARLNGRADDAE